MLWSRLFLGKGDLYVKTLLERAKGSALEIITECNIPIGTITRLSPYARQIRDIQLLNSYWGDIKAFSEINSGPLPLLHTLEINSYGSDSTRGAMAPLSSPLFGGALNLERLVLNLDMHQCLNHFVFPNLTTFELLIQFNDTFDISDLLSFLKTSPLLRSVNLNIAAATGLESVPRGVVVVLPNVETFSLLVRDDRALGVYDIALHISCPCAKRTSLTIAVDGDHMNEGMGVFPTSAPCNTIVHQYTTNPIEEITLKTGYNRYGLATYSLVFRPSDATVITLALEITGDEIYEGVGMSSDDTDSEVFYQAFRTIRGDPLLRHVKRLHIKYDAPVLSDETEEIGDEVGRAFQSVGPLDELTIDGCDLRIFLGGLDPLGPDNAEKPVVFPPIKALTVSQSLEMYYDEEWVDAIVELVQSRHRLGIPFERVTVRAVALPVDLKERLEEWVREVYLELTTVGGL